MFSNRKETVNTKTKGQTVTFAPKGKGTVLSNTPGLNPALKSLAFNKRKNFKLG